MREFTMTARATGLMSDSQQIGATRARMGTRALVASVAVLVACVLPAPPLLANDGGTPIAGQVVLITRPGVTLDDVRAAHPNLSLTPLRAFTPARIHLLAVPLGQEAAYEIQLAADSARVRAAEQNKTVASPEEGTTQSLFLRSSLGEYLSQPGYVEIDAARAVAGRGEPSLVAVLDTGIAPHPVLAGRISPGGYNFVTDTTTTDESGCGAGTPLVGHGTFIAGVIAGVDPDARLLPITVLGCGGVGNAFSVACGVYLAIERGASVINMSFATTISSNAVERAVEDANAAGIVCVSSLSNLSRNTDLERVYPGEHDEVIGVGGLARASGGWERAPFSDWERSSDVAAPAVGVVGTWFDGAQFGYARASGNSYAAALVAGVASMVRSKYGPRDVVWTEQRLCAASETVFIGAPFGIGCGHRDDGFASLINARRAVCPGDYNASTQVDLFDYLDFVAAFNGEEASADFDRSGSVDLFDYLDFAQAFAEGC
ncbi:MAG: S8 family serine peptidase [Planctomycetota bacterium]|nr:S8 family serine peptidase [Planctomycetota bacterium]